MTRIDPTGVIHTNVPGGGRVRSNRSTSSSGNTNPRRPRRQQQQKTPVKDPRGGEEYPSGSGTLAAPTSTFFSNSNFSPSSNSPTSTSTSTSSSSSSNNNNNNNNNRFRRIPGNKYYSLGVLKQLDMYGVVPSYDVPSYKSWVGVFMTVVTLAIFLPYVGSTFYQYIVKPPDLFYQGEIPVLGVGYAVPQVLAVNVVYTDGTTGIEQVLTSDNLDRYFRLRAVHTTVRNRDSEPREYVDLKFKGCSLANGQSDDAPLFETVCLDIPDGLELRGEYVDESYKYIELNVVDCIDGASGDDAFAASECATREEIDAAIQSGVKVSFSVVVQNIDLNLYHAKGMDAAIVEKEASERFYLFPGTRFLNEVYLQGRHFYHEVPHIGSPPITPPEQAILDFGSIASRIRAYKPSNGEHISFFIRLEPKVRIEQTSYWTPTVMDLLGMWGAVFSFLSTMSFGLIATCYNQRNGDKSFEKRTGILSEDDEEHGNVIMDTDIRLFNKEHFDQNGRLRLTKQEIYNPTTVFGELRYFAMTEHTKRQKAARTLSSFFRRRFSRTSSLFKSNRLEGGNMAEVAKLMQRPRQSSNSNRNSMIMVESGGDMRNSTLGTADTESIESYSPPPPSHDSRDGQRRKNSASRSRSGSGRFELPRQPSLTKDFRP